MLRIRSIHYNSFKSSKLAALSAEGERLWWRMQCLCDDDGRSEDDPEVICGFVFPKRRDITPDDVDKWLGEMDELGLIERYEVAGRAFIQVAQWHEYQHPRRPQTSKIPGPSSSVSVATSPSPSGPDLSRHVVQEGRWSGDEIRGTEGESEGEPEPAPRAPEPVDNPYTARVQQIASKWSQPA